MWYIVCFLMGAGFAEFLDGSVTNTIDNAQKAREEIAALMNDEEQFHKYILQYLSKLQEEGEIIITSNAAIFPKQGMQFPIQQQQPAVVQTPTVPAAPAIVLQK